MSFKPETYGTEALMEVIRRADSSPRDSAGAARELSKRTLTKDDGQELFSLLKMSRSSKVDVELLKTIEAHDMRFLTKSLLKFQSSIQDSDVARQNAETILAFIESDKEDLKFMLSLLQNSTHAQVRTRAVLYLHAHEDVAFPIFMDLLKNESSASVAKAMCDGLVRFGNKKALPMLTKIANDVTREYETDRYLKKRATANDVRESAVMGVERIKMSMRR